jgi:hypothetical protein
MGEQVAWPAMAICIRCLGERGAAMLRPYKEENWEKWGLVRSLVRRFVRPGADHGHPGDDGVCGGNLGLEPLWKCSEVTERLEGKIKLPNLRKQTAKNVGDPTREFRIIPERHLQTHGWCRQPRLLENPVKSEAHLRVCTGTPEGLVD